MAPATDRVGRRLARAAGVPEEPLSWTLTEGPWFDNQIATLELDGRRARVRLETAIGRGHEDPRLVEVAARRLP
jgi:hypothetical protein